MPIAVLTRFNPDGSEEHWEGVVAWREDDFINSIAVFNGVSYIDIYRDDDGAVTD